MGRYIKFCASVIGVLALVMLFQNCGRTNSSAQAQELYIHFDDLQNTQYEVVYTDCNQGSQCLLTLHSVSDTNTPLGTQIKTTPEFTENAEQATDAAPRTGIYCDVTYQSGFGDVYVSCPLDVQSEEGFYIRL